LASNKRSLSSMRSQESFSHLNGRTNFKLALPYGFRKVKSENLKGEFTRSQRSTRSSLFTKFGVLKRIVYLR
jgi:hypothetical protein